MKRTFSSIRLSASSSQYFEREPFSTLFLADFIFNMEKSAFSAACLSVRLSAVTIFYCKVHTDITKYLEE